jgi:hypothetical protein
MPTLKERLAKLEKKLADLNAKHPETDDKMYARIGVPTSYAKNRADAPRSKVELERRGLTQRISILQQKLGEGGRRTRRHRRKTRRHH